MATDQNTIQEMSDADLDALAITLKEQELEYLAESRERRAAVRGEILQRAERSYAIQQIQASGIPVTEEVIAAVLDAKRSGLHVINEDPGAVVVRPTNGGE